MCIAILKKPTGELTKETLQTCWNNNNDGGGILYLKNNTNTLVRLVELKSFEKFYENYLIALEEGGLNNMLLHFRIATAGSVIDTNAHPFIVNKDIGFIHNGVIGNTQYPKDLDVSDTWLFNEKLKTIKDKKWWKNQFILELINYRIGTTGNKLVFLTSDGSAFIINETLGFWKDDVWFSNRSCEYTPPKRYTTYHNTNYVSNHTPNNNRHLPHRKDWERELEKFDNCECCNCLIYTDKEMLNGICTRCFEEEYPHLTLHELVF